MSIFPFIDSGESTESSADELPLLKEYAYDFEKNELLLDKNGHTYMVEKNEALRIWILKALTAERYHYTAYSSAFGAEYQDNLVGHAINAEVLKLEMERYITEALMVNPYIKRLDDFKFDKSATGLTVTFDCTSVYGTDKIPIPMKEVRI
jgi:hypothetical protein